MKRPRPPADDDNDDDDDNSRGNDNERPTFANRNTVQNQARTQHINGSVFHGPIYHGPIYSHGQTSIRSASTASTHTSDPLERWRNCLDSLRSTHMDSRRDTIKKAHMQTCQWFLGKEEYGAWLDDAQLPNHHGFLWVKGKPGTGKSTLTKYVLTHAIKSPGEAKPHIISFFFNARGGDLEKSTAGLYRSLLVQLLDTLPDLQDVLATCSVTAVPSADTTSYEWDNGILQHLLRTVVERLGQRSLLCFVDALDECTDDQARDMVRFFEDLGDLAISSGIRFRTWFSSRHYPHITIRKCLSLTLEDQIGHHDDITMYLASELRVGRSKRAESIRSEILGRASGIFLWVVLVVKILNEEYDHGRIHALQGRLNKIPNDLEDLFNDILTRDGPPGAELMLCLQWVLFARRPLQLEELYCGILVGIENGNVEPWDPEETSRTIVARFVLHASKGLIEETKGRHKSVQFIHESVRDFFLGGSGLQSRLFGPSETFIARSHNEIKRCCHAYYTSADLKVRFELPEQLPKANGEESIKLRETCKKTFPLIEYAVQNMLYHSNSADDMGSPQDKFLYSLDFERWIFSRNVIQQYEVARYTPNASLLYVLAEEDLSRLVTLEMQRAPAIDISGERFGSPLFAAAAKNSRKALNALLRPPTSSTRINRIGEPMLLSNHTIQEATDVLLKARGDLHKKYSPLPWAVACGEVELVKCLFANAAIDINRHGYFNKESVRQLSLPPLALAMIFGFADVVDVLLSSDNDTAMSFRDSPILHVALYYAMLEHDKRLARIAYADEQNQFGDINEVIQLRLESVRTRNYTGVLKILLAHEHVHVNLTASLGGHKPLILAILGRYAEGIRLLLAHKDIDVNGEDRIWRSPLLLVTMSRYAEAMELLLAHKDIDVNCRPFGSSYTPLYRATEIQYVEGVQLLLAHRNIDVNKSEGIFSYQTPLCVAAKKGDIQIMKLLLSHKDIDVNAQDGLGWTPLHVAAIYGRIHAVALLLEHRETMVNARSVTGQTPLDCAVSSNHQEVVELLTAQSYVRPTRQGRGGSQQHPESCKEQPQGDSACASEEIEEWSNGLLREQTGLSERKEKERETRIVIDLTSE